MAVTTYTWLDGEIVGQNANGVKRDFVPDPLGSTVALLDSSQTKTDTFAYSPPGEIRAQTGLGMTPFQFGGSLGTRAEFPPTHARMLAGGHCIAAGLAKDSRNRSAFICVCAEAGCAGLFGYCGQLLRGARRNLVNGCFTPYDIIDCGPLELDGG